VRRDAERARGLGFGGKLCLHPTQVPVVRAAFQPTSEEVDWARQVLDDASSGAGAVASSTGQMIDKPVLDRARRILDQADQTDQTDQA
jgi:citrate lyase subunit beta/citryl-CoA lyase